MWNKNKHVYFVTYHCNFSFYTNFQPFVFLIINFNTSVKPSLFGLFLCSFWCGMENRKE